MSKFTALPVFGWRAFGQEAPSSAWIPDLEYKKEIAPLFSISCGGKLPSHLGRQILEDWAVCDDSYKVKRSGDLGVFRHKLGRYLFISLDDDRLGHFFQKDRKLLLRIFHHMMHYKPNAIWLLAGDECLGIVVSSAELLSYNALSSSGDLGRDLHTMFSELRPGSSAGMPLDTPWNLFTLKPTARTSNYSGNIATPFSLLSVTNVPFATSCIDAVPHLPYDLWSAPSNSMYGSDTILRSYAKCKFSGVRAWGKIQHGWQATTGLDGEYGFRPEVEAGKRPAFLWSQRNLDCANEAGLTWAKAIGAPWLYMDHFTGPPAYPNSLLAFPNHSINIYRITEGWGKYADHVAGFAKEHGFDRVTVCLYHIDYAVREIRRTLASRGIYTVTCGEPDANFLKRVECMIRSHSAVTSEHIGSSAFYALSMNRPYVVTGPALISDPPDPDEGPSGNHEWIAKNFPELLEFDGTVHKSIADRELGLEHKKTPDELRSMLFGWLED